MKLILLTAILVVNQVCYAQVKPASNTVTKVKYNALKIGEKVPDIDLGEIVNYGNSLPNNKNSVKISDFKGKLLILDFWGAFCSACVESFPKLEKLQEQFGEQIFILPVSFARQRNDGNIGRSVLPLIRGWKGTKREMRLPSTEIIEKQNGLQKHILGQLFPFQSFPTLVWIDQEGIYRGTTQAEALNVINLTDMLNGKRLTLIQKAKLTPVNNGRNILIAQVRNGEIPVYGSNLSKYIDTLQPSFLRLDTGKVNYYRFYAVNWSVNSLYQSAYRQLPISSSWKIDGENIFIDSTFTPFYKNDAYMNSVDYWKRDSVYASNRFCYEAIFPKANYLITDAWAQVVKDLDNYLGVQSNVENREVACLKLVRTALNKMPKAFSQKLSDDEMNRATINKQILMSGLNLGIFIQLLRTKLESLSPNISMIINQTQYNGEVQILFNENDLKDLSSIKEVLQKNGLDLIAGTVKMNVLVLKRVR